jgi:hypothetical protein
MDCGRPSDVDELRGSWFSGYRGSQAEADEAVQLAIQEEVNPDGMGGGCCSPRPPYFWCREDAKILVGKILTPGNWRVALTEAEGPNGLKSGDPGTQNLHVFGSYFSPCTSLHWNGRTLH